MRHGVGKVLAEFGTGAYTYLMAAILEEILQVSISDEVCCGDNLEEDEVERNRLMTNILDNVQNCHLGNGCNIVRDGSAFTVTGPKPKLERMARWLEQTRAELVLVIRGWNMLG